jgi:hypothetical protein
MEKNKRRLAGRLFCLTFGAFFILRAAGYIREINSDRGSIALCRKAMQGARPLPEGYLSRLEGRLAELRSLEPPEGAPQSAAQMNPEDSAVMIRNALRSHAIGVERLRTLSLGGAAATEFTLSSPPANFLRFLQGAADIPLSMSYIGIKPNVHSSAIDVTVRFSHAR